MEIFPLKCSWFPRDGNPSKTELLERIRTVFSYHPKSKRAESPSMQPAGVLFKNQSHINSITLEHEAGPGCPTEESQAAEHYSCQGNAAAAESSLIRKPLLSALTHHFTNLVPSSPPPRNTQCTR